MDSVVSWYRPRKNRAWTVEDRGSRRIDQIQGILDLIRIILKMMRVLLIACVVAVALGFRANMQMKAGTVFIFNRFRNEIFN